MNGSSLLPEYISSAADTRLRVVLSQFVQSTCRGLLLFGDPGVGTTSMARHCCQGLTTPEGERVPLLEMADGAKNKSEGVFWACTLRSCGIDYRDGASTKQLYPTALAHARELASVNSRRRLILMVDDAQYLAARGLRWIYKFVVDLREVAVRPMVVLVGGAAPDSVTRPAKSVVATGRAANLVAKVVEVEGLLSVDEVRECLRRIDDQSETAAFSSANRDLTSPRERLASYAETIWRHFEAIKPADIRRASVPVSAIASFARAAITISGSMRRPISKVQVRSALELHTRGLPVTSFDGDGALSGVVHHHGVGT
jgi:hypothetical protein